MKENQKQNASDRLENEFENIFPKSEDSEYDNDLNSYSKKDIMNSVREIYSKRMDVELRSLKKEHEKELRELKKKIEGLKKLTPKENYIEFSSNWHKNIERIEIELLKVDPKGRIGKCPMCIAFVDKGYLSQLRELYASLNLPEGKWLVEVKDVDPVDIIYGEKTYPEFYDDNLTVRGFNYYYGLDFLIESYPALIINIIHKSEYINGILNQLNGKSNKEKYLQELDKINKGFTVIQGIGVKKNGEYNCDALIEAIILFIKDFDDAHFSKKVKFHPKSTDYEKSIKQN